MIAQPQTTSGLPGSERFGAAVGWLPSGNLVVVDPVFDRADGMVNVDAKWIYRADLRQPIRVSTRMQLSDARRRGAATLEEQGPERA